MLGVYGVVRSLTTAHAPVVRRRRPFSLNLFEQFERAMLRAPAANVGPMHTFILQRDDILGVLTVRGSATSIRPAPFGNHHIFRRGDEHLASKNRDAPPTAKPLVIMGIVAQKEEFDDER